MSIFNTLTPIQTTTIDIDFVYGLRSAYVEMMDVLEEAEKAVEKANDASARVGVSTHCKVENNDRDSLAYLFWRKFLKALPVTKVMSLKRREQETEKWLYPSRSQYSSRPKPPDFTVENMMKRAVELEERREFFIREWALDLFEQFVHWRPSIEEAKVPTKVVKTVLSSDGVAFRYQDEIANLDCFFHFLDGAVVDFPDDDRESPLVVAVAEAMKHGNGRGVTNYFRFVAYSGNKRLHLTFTRRDLVTAWENLAREGLIARMEA